MKRVGVLVGRERTFPDAIIKGINDRSQGEVVAEYIKLDGIRYDDPPKYDLVIDRISHEVPFYRATLKRMARTIVTQPFRSADRVPTHWSQTGRRNSQDRVVAAERLHRGNRQ